jgi:hypothetical protein
MPALCQLLLLRRGKFTPVGQQLSTKLVIVEVTVEGLIQIVIVAEGWK